MVSKIRKILSNHRVIYGLTLSIILIISIIYGVKGHMTDKEVSRAVYQINNISTYKSVSEENLKNYNLDNYKYMSSDTFDELINYLEKKNKISEAYLLKGYKNILNNNDDDYELKKNLEKSVENVKKSTNIMTKIYSGKLLAQLYFKNGDYSSAVDIVKYSLNNIDRKYYNNYYEDIVNLISTIIDSEHGRAEMMLLCEDIIDNYEKLSKQAKLYLIVNLKDLFILSGNYAKASEYIIRGCYIAYDLQENFTLAKCITDLGVIFRKIENHDRAIDLINEAGKIQIEDIKDNAYIKSYININLAEIYAELSRYEEADMVLNKIEEYREYFSKEDYRDIEILSFIVNSQVSIYNNDLIKAKEDLDTAKKLLGIDRDNLFFDKNIEYYIGYGNYLEASGKYTEAIDLYNKMLTECKDDGNIYNCKRIMKKVTRLAIQSKNYNLEEKYIIQLADLINNSDGMVYSDYSHYIAETVRSEIFIEKQKDKNGLIFRMLSICITTSTVIFSLFFWKIRKLRKQNQKDGLTKVYNRNYFNEMYNRFLLVNKDFSLIMIDIDNFKKLNDTFGHQFGDKVLINSCNAINEILGKDSELCRYGGEEFVVISTNKTKEDVRDLAEKIRVTVEQLRWDEDVKITLSLGVSYSDEKGKFTLEDADKNLYIAKTSGKNKVV